ncbi:MAG: hypothetical protein MUO97_05475 [Dehalococcoidia bacterium]|nr:hypothetical protein [Dehalococcoidia bacterium]
MAIYDGAIAFVDHEIGMLIETPLVTVNLNYNIDKPQDVFYIIEKRLLVSYTWYQLTEVW